MTSSLSEKRYCFEGAIEFYEYICTCSADERQASFASYTLTKIDVKMHKCNEAKQKCRGMFENQKSGNKTSSGLDIRTHASPKVGQDQVSGLVSVLC